VVYKLLFDMGLDPNRQRRASYKFGAGVGPGIDFGFAFDFGERVSRRSAKRRAALKMTIGRKGV